VSFARYRDDKINVDCQIVEREKERGKEREREREKERLKLQQPL